MEARTRMSLPAKDKPPSVRPFLGPAYGPGSNRLRGMSETQLRQRDAIRAEDKAEDYEEAPCPCGAASDTELASVERHGLDCRNVLCQSCGLIRISPRWKESRYQRFYETQYRDLYNRIEISKEEFSRAAAASKNVAAFGEWVVRNAERNIDATRPIQAVEIGAGAGWNLSRLPSGWMRTGYDVDEEYLRLGEKLFGIRMKPGLLDSALADVAEADIIILSHVVEHFMDPKEALRSMAMRMKPEALLLIEVPGLFRIHRTALDPMVYLQNAHTFTFCAQTLAAACESAGLEILSCDEECRAVCRVSKGGTTTPRSGEALPAQVLRYLRACETGFAIRASLKGIPVAGRILSALWKRAYFPCLKFLLPPSLPNRAG